MRIRITTGEGEILNVPFARIDRMNNEPCIVFNKHDESACSDYEQAYADLMGEEPGEAQTEAEHCFTLLPFNGPYTVVVL